VDHRGTAASGTARGERGTAHAVADGAAAGKALAGTDVRGGSVAPIGLGAGTGLRLRRVIGAAFTSTASGGSGMPTGPTPCSRKANGSALADVVRHVAWQPGSGPSCQRLPSPSSGRMHLYAPSTAGPLLGAQPDGARHPVEQVPRSLPSACASLGFARRQRRDRAGGRRIVQDRTMSEHREGVFVA
jgi:hypothetical protein